MKIQQRGAAVEWASRALGWAESVLPASEESQLRERTLRERIADLEQGAERRTKEAQRREEEAQRREEVVQRRVQDLEQRLEQADREVDEANRKAQDAERRLQGSDKPFSVVKMREIQITDEELGRGGWGGWGAVKVARFRGVKVAARCLHDAIHSPYNRDLFIREMNVDARVCHPNTCSSSLGPHWRGR